MNYETRKILKREKPGIEQRTTTTFIGGHIVGSLWRLSATNAGLNLLQSGVGSKGMVDRDA
jgi:hypothetical protein